MRRRWWRGATGCLVAVLAGCQAAPDFGPDTPDAPAAVPDQRSLADLLRGADADFDPGLAAALLATMDRPDADVRGALAALDAWAARIAERLPRTPRPRECIATAVQVLYDEAGLAADPNDEDGANPDNLHLDRVVARRRGYCVSLSAIWLGVGWRLGWPLQAVRLPGHFLVRWDDGRDRWNIETTDFGAVHDDDRYRERYRVHPQAEAAGIYLASLPPRAVCAEICNNRGVLAQRAGDGAAAERWLDRAVALAPDHPTALYNRAVVRQQRGDVDGALTDVSAAIDRDPNHAFALVNRADLWRLRGDPARAEADLARAAQVDPQYGGAAIARAMFALDRGDLDAAAAAVAAAERQSPDDARTWIAKARLLRMRDDPTAALLAANQALVHDRGAAEAWAERALAYAAMDNHARAVESWNAAIERAPDRVDIRRNRAVSRAQSGDTAGAIDDLRRVVQQAPDWAPGFEALGKVLAASGDRSAAIPHLRTALRLAPDAPGAQALRKLLAQLGG